MTSKNVAGARVFAPVFTVLSREDDPKFTSSVEREVAYRIPQWIDHRHTPVSLSGIMKSLLRLSLGLAGLSVALFCVTVAEASELHVSSDFPGGSGIVESIDQEARVIRMIPAEGPGWDSWWYVRIDGVRPGEEVILDVGGGIWATPNQAVFSLDGKEWRQTAPGDREGNRIIYRQKIENERAWFAWKEPFVLEQAVALVQRAAEASPYAEVFELARSREGRTVPALRVVQPGAPEAERFQIWVQARQHAWEVGSSWTCQGFVEWLVSDDPRAENLRRAAEIHIVPIMDIDNVERGAGGKDQQPHDHNRDWSDQPHWPEVQATMERISRMVQENRFDLLVDLHNPHPRERDCYFFVAQDAALTPAQQKNQSAFLASAEKEMNGALPFRGNTRPFSYGATEPPLTTARMWVINHTTDNAVGTTLEIPWNSPDSTAANYLKLGRQLGLAIELFVREANGLSISTDDKEVVKGRE